MSGIVSYIAGKHALEGLREEEVLKKLKKANAKSPESAKSLEEARLTKKERERLSSLLKQNKVRKTRDGRYYTP